MNIKIGTLDFETKEPFSLKKYGSGWPIGKTKIIGAAIQDVEHESNLKWYDKVEDILHIVNDMETIICHNVQYDCGLLTMLGVDLKNKTIIDTKNLAFFHYNLEANYSLAYLASKHLGAKKGQDLLGMAVIGKNLYHTSTGKNQKPQSLATATEYAYCNLDILYQHVPSVVSDYCLQDVRLTTGLYKKFIHCVSKEWIEILSDVNKQYLLMKQRGVDFDLTKLNNVRSTLMALALEAQEEIWKILKIHNGDPKWLNSKAHLTKFLDQLRIKYPYTAPSSRYPSGQPSVTGTWLDSQPHIFCKTLSKLYNYNTYLSKYVDGMLDYRDKFHPGNNGVITVYPDYMVMSAQTGRGSCNHPNMKNFPNFDKDKLNLEVIDDNTLGFWFRDCIVNRGGYVLENDYKQQEFRIFAEGCSLLGFNRIRDLYIDDPSIDFHSLVAKEITHMDRGPTKAINFGVLYGKGIPSLAFALGKTEEETKVIRTNYDEMFPEAKKYADSLKYVGKTRGWINLDDRKVYAQKPMVVNGRTKEYYYKLSNWYCQGRGANQIMKVMSALYKLGITPYYEVYDALGFAIDGELQSSDNITHIKLIKRVMETENTFKCSVPMLVDTGVGKSWAEAKSKQGEHLGVQLYV